MKILLLLVMMLIFGCDSGTHPAPCKVGVSCNKIGVDKNTGVKRFSLHIEVSARAQVSSANVQVDVPGGVEIEKCILATFDGDKALSSESLSPEGQHRVVWHGEIHPEPSRMQKWTKSYPVQTKIVDVIMRTAGGDLPLCETLKVNVSLDYYGDPYASDGYVPYGSYSKSFEFGSERLK